MGNFFSRNLPTFLLEIKKSTISYNKIFGMVLILEAESTVAV